jgi:hypothetical protein
MTTISPPFNTVPSTQSVDANTSAALDGFKVLDGDPTTSIMTTTLSVSHGTLTVVSPGALTISSNGTDSVVLTGTADEISDALRAHGSVHYEGAHDFFGVDTLTMTTTDDGPFGRMTDTDTVTILVNALTGSNQDESFTALPGNERIDAGGGVDTVSFGYKLTDARVSFSGDTTIIDGPNGSHTVLTGVEKFAFTDGTVDNNDDDVLVNDLFYYAQYHDVWNAHADADAHFHQMGWREGRMPNASGIGGPLIVPSPHIAANGFDYDYYLAHNPDVAAAGVDAFQHFEMYGWREGRNPNALFDTTGYLTAYADVKAAGINPLDHYDQSGWKEGRDPSTAFDTTDYLAQYTDVAAAHVNPLAHFLQSGEQEGRHAFNDGVWG